MDPAELKKKLTPEQWRILFKRETELPFSGKLLLNKEKGVYCCAACGTELFSSDTKYDSGCGWPSFFSPLVRSRIQEIPDFSAGLKRTEIRCANCGGHLGHVFDDGPVPTGMRYCVNSLSLDFRKNPQAEKKSVGAGEKK